MLTRYACTAAELSCVIGNIFAELSPPCAACGAEVLQITGTTVTGNAATLTVTEAGFDFDGCADDTAMIERMRKGRCIYAKTGAGAERTDGIQRDCESERPSYLTESGAVIRKVRRRSKNNMKRKLKKLAALHAAGRIDAKTVEQSYQSWRGHAEKGNSYHLIRRTDHYYNSLMKPKEAAQCQKH